MTATRTDPVPDISWRSPFEYKYEIANPEPERWDGVKTAVQKSADPTDGARLVNLSRQSN